MPMATLAEKMQFKQGQSMALINVPDGYAQSLAAEMSEVEIGDADRYDGVLAFVNTLAEAGKIAPQTFAAVADDALVWIAYPKQSSGIDTDVNRDTLWESTNGTGWRPVRQVSIDDTWSAVRYRPESAVGR
jgi:hypothetical protein